MRYPKWFARWRMRVWDNRLTDWRKAWHRAQANDEGYTNRLETDGHYERLVTQALVKRTLWRKRAGVRKLSAAPDRPEA